MMLNFDDIKHPLDRLTIEWFVSVIEREIIEARKDEMDGAAKELVLSRIKLDLMDYLFASIRANEKTH